MKLIVDLPGATFAGQDQGNGNELVFDAKPDAPPDATAFRFGTRGETVKLSFDDLPQGAGREAGVIERLMLEINHDDNFPKSVPVKCLELRITDPDMPFADAAEKLVARLGLKGLELFVPLKQGVPASTPAPTPVQLGTQDGRYIVADQADGNLVVYDHGVAVWDRWTHEAGG